MSFKLKQYTDKSYKELADEFESHFIQDKFKTSSENNFRDMYEFNIHEMNHWINRLGFEISNFGEIYGSQFKIGLFTELKKRGWSKTKFPGRWKKIIYK